MKARIQQARRDVLRGHNYAEAVSKNPSKAILKRIGKIDLVCVAVALLAPEPQTKQLLRAANHAE